MSRLGFYFDMNRCVGCRTCQIACKDVNDLGVGPLYRRVANFELGAFPSVSAFNYSATCNHCENPACVAVCPTGAMHKADDGTVQHDDDACLGCQYCVMACPYSVPQYLEERGITGKCDSCAGLRAQGEQPACVASCIMRCLDFGDLDELREKYGDDLVSEVSVLPSKDITGPSVLVNAKDAAREPIENVRVCLV